MGIEPATILALVVAGVALVVAFGQATQQYFITGQSIRLCDSVVFADLPGEGRRVWQMSQFRFRVVYSIPQISLPNRFWPPNWSVSYKEGRNQLPELSQFITQRMRMAPPPNIHRLTERGADDEEAIRRRVPFRSVIVDHPRPFDVVEDIPYSRRHSVQSSSYMSYRENRLQKVRYWFLGMKFRVRRWMVSWKLRWITRKIKHSRRGRLDVSGPRTGEAAWVSFCRVIHYSCRDCVRYDFVERDVDRCPADLPTVPMPLSLRDVVVMALSVGMQCTEASFTARSISMQGTAGILATSQHPVLGPLLHFTPGDMSVLHGIVGTGMISILWLTRTWDICCVGDTQFDNRERRNVEKTTGVWIHRIRSSAPTSRDLASAPNEQELEDMVKKMERRKAVVEEEECKPADPTAAVVVHLPLPQRKAFHDGNWELRMDALLPISLPISPHINIVETTNIGQTAAPDPAAINLGDHITQENSTEAKLNVPKEKKPYQATVEDERNSKSQVHLPFTDQATGEPATNTNLDTIAGPSDNEEKITPSDDPLEEMRREAVKRQTERNARAAKIADDEIMVKKLEKAGRVSNVVPGQLLLEWRPNNAARESDAEATTFEAKPLTPEEQEALDREEKRKKERKQRDDARHARNDEQGRVIARYGRVNWFWLSQTDIIPGFWATPWRNFSSLDPLTCSGAVTIILNALRGFTDSNSLRYVNSWKGLGHPAMVWVLDGRSTFPAYAHNARSGVVCSGDYPSVKVDVFKEMIPAIELLSSYEYQIKRDRRMTTGSCQSELLELMKLDAWLSICGRTDEIVHGRNDLIKQTPAMVQLLMDEFDYDFVNLDQSDQEGGMQVNQELAANVMDFLLDEELSGAEQMYILVATLRTMKVGQCILDGPDTRMLQDILREDVQVHMV